MSITSILHQEVKSSSLSVKEIAASLEKPYHTLMSELSGQEGHKLGVEFLLPIMKLTKSNEAMNYLARELGGTFIMVGLEGKSENALSMSLVSSVKEFGEFVSECAGNIEDGIICQGDIKRIEKEGQEALNAIMQLMQLAKDLHTEQYGHLYAKNRHGSHHDDFKFQPIKKESINEVSI